jgi:Domain of unknown function (DUF6089)
MPKFYILIILLFFAGNLKAQSWELGGSFGGSGYMGDLNENNPLSISGISYGGFVQRNYNGYLSTKFNYTHGKISAADANSNNAQDRARNLSFTTTLNEFAIINEFNFLNYIPEVGKNKFTPYIYLGVAAANYVPTTVYKGVVYNLRNETTEGQAAPYSTTALSIPYGAGFKVNIMGAWTLSADIGYRNTNTDYLDDVGGVYPSAGVFTSAVAKALSDRSGETTGIYTATPGSQRGGSNTSDTYFFVQFSISFTFLSSKCSYAY